MSSAIIPVDFRRRRNIAAALLAALLALAADQGARAAPAVGQKTGLPLPRFVSLKAMRANVRAGPGLEYRVKWTYQRRGIPLEIVAEYANWRKIRDWDAATGWIHGALLSSERTAVVSPWQSAETVALRAEPDAEAASVASIHPGVFVRIGACVQGWCRITVRKFEGYVRQNRLWGVYPREEIRNSSLF